MRLCERIGCDKPIPSDDRRRRYCSTACAELARAEKMRVNNRSAYDRRKSGH